MGIGPTWGINSLTPLSSLAVKLQSRSITLGTFDTSEDVPLPPFNVVQTAGVSDRK